MNLETKRYRLTDIAEVERVKKDEIYPAGTVYIQVSATQGQVLMLREAGRIETKYATITPKEEMGPFYFCEAVRRCVPDFCERYQSTLNISIHDFKFFQIDIHEDKETRMYLNTLFEAYNNTIESQEEHIENLKYMKKAMLQKMMI